MAWGLLTGLMIFRIPLYFPHASSSLPKARESQHICLPPDLPLACFTSLCKLEVYFLEFAGRVLRFDIFLWALPPLPLGSSGALPEDSHPLFPWPAFLSSYLKKGLPLLSMGLLVAVFRRRVLRTTNECFYPVLR